MFGIFNRRMLAGRMHLPRYPGIALSLEIGKRAVQMHCRRHRGPAVLTWHTLEPGGLFVMFSSCFQRCVPWRTVQVIDQHCWAEN